MFTNSKLLNDAEGNENLNKIMMAIESLPEDTKTIYMLAARSSSTGTIKEKDLKICLRQTASAVPILFSPPFPYLFLSNYHYIMKYS